MSDLTIIYYTANYISEEFARKTREQLLKVIGDTPLISVSQKPMDFGHNICVGDTGRSHINIYRQALRGAKEATTRDIALAEDDVLYSRDHFHTALPNRKTPFLYNIHKWSIYTWSKPPMFSYRNRMVINSLIADRLAFVGAIEERLRKYPRSEKVGGISWGEPGRNEKALDLKERNAGIFHSEVPNIVFSHPEAVGYGHLGKKKRMGYPRLRELPYWGKAEDILGIYQPK